MGRLGNITNKEREQIASAKQRQYIAAGSERRRTSTGQITDAQLYKEKYGKAPKADYGYSGDELKGKSTDEAYESMFGTGRQGKKAKKNALSRRAVEANEAKSGDLERRIYTNPTEKLNALSDEAQADIDLAAQMLEKAQSSRKASDWQAYKGQAALAKNKLSEYQAASILTGQRWDKVEEKMQAEYEKALELQREYERQKAELERIDALIMEKEKERSAAVDKAMEGVHVEGAPITLNTGTQRYLDAGAAAAGNMASDFAGALARLIPDDDVGNIHVQESTKALSRRLSAVADDLQARARQDTSEAKEGLGTVGQTLVDAAILGMELLGDAAMGYGAGAVLGVARKTASTASLFTRAAGSAAMSAEQDGADRGEQIAYGLAVGAAEVAMEKVSALAKPLKAIFGKGVTDSVIVRATEKAAQKLAKTPEGRTALNTLLTTSSSAISEGLEEVGSDLLEPIIRKYTYDGDLKIKDEYDIEDITYDFLLGAILGGTLGGVSALSDSGQILDSYRQQAANAAIDKYYEIAGKEGVFSEKAQEAAREAAKSIEEQPAAYAVNEVNAVQRPVDGLMQDIPASHIAYEEPLQMAVREPDASAGTTGTAIKTAAESRQDTGGRISQPADGVNGNSGIAQIGTEQTVPTAGRAERAAASAAEKVARTEAIRVRDIKAVAQFADGLGAAGKTAFNELYDGTQDGVDYIQAMNSYYNAGKKGTDIGSVQNPGGVLTAPQTQAAYLAGQVDRRRGSGLEGAKRTVYTDITNNIKTEGTAYGGKEIYTGNGGEWTGGQDTSGKLRTVESPSGRDQSGQRQVKYADSEAASLTYEGGKVSTASFGITKGSTKAGVYKVRGETAAMQSAKKMARERGLRVTFFAGGNLVINGEEVRGYISRDRVFIRADHPEYTAEQLMRHEAGHDMIRKGEVDADEVRDRLGRVYTANELEAISSMYTEAYEGSQLTPEDIWEEIICDSLGDINIFSGGEFGAEIQSFLDKTRSSARQARGRTDKSKVPPKFGKASRETWKESQTHRGNIYDYSKSFAQQIEDYEAGKIPKYDTLLVGGTPEVWKRVGLNSIPVTFPTGHVKEILQGNMIDHDFGKEFLKQLPEKIKEPVAIIASKTRPSTSLVVLLDMSHKGKKIIVPVVVDGFGMQNGISIDSNSITSMHKRENATRLLENAIKEDTPHSYSVFYLNIEKSADMLKPSGLQLPGHINKAGGYIHSITEPGSPVKPKFSNITETQQFKRWFKGSRVVDGDGRPLVVYQDGTEGLYFTNTQSAKGDPSGVYLSMKKPYRTKDGYILKGDELQRKGYDGVIAEISAEETRYAVFDPTQIKSATDNIGSFDSSNPDIRYSRDIKGKPVTEAQRQVLEAIRAKNKRLLEESIKGMTPAEIANMKPEEADTTPPVPERRSAGINGSNGGKESRFYQSAMNSRQVEEQTRDLIETVDDIKYYASISNMEELDSANDRLNSMGRRETERWLDLEPGRDSIEAVDIAEGFILLRRYQQAGDYEGAVRVARRLREMGTSAGQTVQAFSILGRLTPEAMTVYAQKELDQALAELRKVRSAKWAEKQSQAFQLTPDEVEFIKTKTELAATLPDGRDKNVALAEIAALLESKIPTSTRKMIKAWTRNAMLLNPKTVLSRNAGSNLLMMPMYAVTDFISAPIDKALSKKSGVRTKGVMLPTKANLAAAKKGVFESFDDFRRHINTRQVNGDRFEIGRGDSFKQYRHEEIKAQNRPGIKAAMKMSNAMNKVDRLTGFLLDVGDRPFFELYFTNSLNNQLRLNHATEPTAEMVEMATQEALQRTWQDKNGVTEAANRVRDIFNGGKEWGLGSVLVPFTATPANLAKAIFEYSPAGLVDTLVRRSGVYLRSVKSSNFDPRTQKALVEGIGKGLAGTLTIAIARYLFLEGLLTGGDDDKDKNLRAFEKNIMGKAPYSVTVGGKSFSYDWAQPVGSLFAMTADYMQNVQAGNEPMVSGLGALGDNFKILLNAMTTGGNVIYEQSFLQGISELFGENDFVSGAITAAANGVTQFVPTALQQIAQIIDPYARTSYENKNLPQTTLNKLMAKVPGLREKLPITVDVMGQDMMAYAGNNNPLNVFLNPSNMYAQTATKAALEIYRIYEATADPSVIPNTAPQYLEGKYGKFNFTGAEKNSYQRTMGQTVTDTVNELLGMDAYAELDDTTKASILGKIKEYSTAMAKQEFYGTKDIEYEMNSWVAEAQNVSDAGLSVGQYLMAYTLTSGMEGIKAKGETIKNSAGLKKMEAIYTNLPGLTQEQYRYLFDTFDISSEFQKYSYQEVVEALDAMRVESEYSEKHWAATETSIEQSANQIISELKSSSTFNGFAQAEQEKALELVDEFTKQSALIEYYSGLENYEYMPKSWVKNSQGLSSAGLSEADYILYRVALQMADDANGGNNNYTQDEAKTALSMLDGLDRKAKAFLFQSTDSDWKTNPYG